MAEEFQFVALDDEEEELIRNSAGRGKRVAAPILQQFLKSGMKSAKLSRESVEKTGQTANKLVASLKQFAKSREMPVDALLRGGEVYVLRKEVPTKKDE